jgi:hypothetical protein
MLKGDNISTARGVEKTRRDRAMSKNKYVREAGKLAGGALSGIAGFVITNRLGSATKTLTGHRIATKIFGKYAPLISYGLNHPGVQLSIAAGAAKVGYMMSGDLAVSANMRARGYDPNRR